MERRGRGFCHAGIHALRGGGHATDPVAVVALLKELGASKKLGTLIEGESSLMTVP